MKRITLVCVLLTLASLGIGMRAASGGKICVGYGVTAPIVGTRSGQRCLPDPFSHTFTVDHCEAVPPFGVSACATVSVDTP